MTSWQSFWWEISEIEGRLLGRDSTSYEFGIFFTRQGSDPEVARGFDKLSTQIDRSNGTA